MTDLQQIGQLLLLTCGGLLVAALMVFRPEAGSAPRRALAVALAIAALLGPWSYTKWGEFHDYGRYGTHSYHYHDIWHYALGAKYYPELGYTGMYDCSAVALDELGREGVAVPKIEQVRILADPMQYYLLDQRLGELTASCHQAFTPERWTAFKADQRTWLELGFDTRWWQVMLFDLGFNPPPSWNVIAHTLLRIVPITPLTLEAFPYIDMGLLLVIVPLVIARSFNPWAAAGYLVVFGTNFAASYAWTGGSYCRQLWFAALALGLCALAAKRWRVAGVLLGLSVGMRVFPAVFLVGAALPLARGAIRSAEDRKALLELTVAATATLGTLVGLSLLMFDPALWGEFFHKIDEHGATYFVWHLGFKKWATWTAAAAGQDFWFGPGLARFVAWNEMLQATWDRHAWLYQAERGALIAAALGLSAWRRPAEAALLFGGVAMFGLTIPANYYYVWLAMIPAVYVVERAGIVGAVRILALFGALAILNLAKWFSPDALVQNFHWNRAVLGFMVVWIATAAVEEPMVVGAARRLLAGVRNRPAMTAAGLVVALVGGLGARELTRDRRPNVLIVAIDALRLDAMGVYGSPSGTTPRIDRIAADATVFERAYTPTPQAAPALASVLTSASPTDHEVFAAGRRLPDRVWTLAEELQARGYRTAAVVGDRSMRQELGFNQGFSRYDSGPANVENPQHATTSKPVTDAAIRALDGGGPFLLVAQYGDPALEYIAHPGPRPPAASHPKRAAYEGEVAFTDRHVGRLLDALEERGLADDTIVVILGTAGEEIGDHDGAGHGQALFEESVRVPLIVRAPGIAPTRRHELVSAIDVAPTILGLIGGRTPDSFRGVAIPAVGGELVPAPGRVITLGGTPPARRLGVIDWPWKLVRERGVDGPATLYALDRDPGETQDQSAANPAEVARLSALIDAPRKSPR